MLRDSQALKLTQDIAAASEAMTQLHYGRLKPILDKQEALAFSPPEMADLLQGTAYDGVPVSDLTAAFAAISTLVTLLEANSEDHLRALLAVIP